MAVANSDIRKEISSAGLRLWQVADALGMHDSNFSRLLRKELSEKDRDRIRQAILSLKGEKQ